MIFIMYLSNPSINIDNNIIIQFHIKITTGDTGDRELQEKY